MIVTDVKRIVCSPQQLVANFMTFVAIVTLDADGLYEELVILLHYVVQLLLDMLGTAIQWQSINPVEEHAATCSTSAIDFNIK